MDAAVRARILERIVPPEGVLWMSPYSAKQFPEDSRIVVSDECLARAGEGEFCFLERERPSAYEQRMEKIVLFCWNRVYPSDMRWDVPVPSEIWRLQESSEFSGTSHEKITMEVYVK